jgi:hypothetical protein
MDRKGFSAQSSLEYLTIFSAALLLLAVVIIIIAVFSYVSKPTTSTNSQCYISSELYCLQVLIGSNGLYYEGIVAFTNNLGTGINFASNSLVFYPISSGTAYYGICLPANALRGSLVVCNATMQGWTAQNGSQLTPRFVLHYTICSGSVCTYFNTTGSGTTYMP